MSNTQRFEGKVILITGAASGLGLATAQRLATEGAKLALVDLTPEGLAAAVRSLPAGSETVTVAADVAQLSQVQAYVAQTLQRFDPLVTLTFRLISVVPLLRFAPCR